jgi:hypothetical protein
MSKALAKHTDYNALDDAIGSDIDGDPLRFKDGIFVRGFDKIEVEEGTRLRIAPTSVQDGFVRWEDGKPVDWRLREWVRTDQLPIFRDALPDADKIGQSDDPWSYCLLLAMKDEDGELVKFSTVSQHRKRRNSTKKSDYLGQPTMNFRFEGSEERAPA